MERPSQSSTSRGPPSGNAQASRIRFARPVPPYHHDVPRLTASWDRLSDRRGVLIQLPPGMERDDPRLDFLLGTLPWWVPTAVEFRHPSWVCDEVLALLEGHQSAYVVMSGAGLRAYCARRRRGCTSGCMVRMSSACTPGPTPTRTCGGGLTGSETGGLRDVMCRPSSTRRRRERGPQRRDAPLIPG